MAIFQEIDRALHDEAMKLAIAPRDTMFLIVLSREARNEMFEEMLRDRTRVSPGKMLGEERYRGCVVAVADDEGLPRISIFTKAKKGRP